MNNTIKTDDLENQLSDISNFSDYIKENNTELINTDLAAYLEKLIEKTGCKKADIVRRTNLNRAYVYQIFEGRKTPSRDKLIAVAIGMQLKYEEIQKLLKYAGLRPLYARDVRDAAIIFSVKKGFGFDETNLTLYDQGLKVLE